jgi:hypothetical protein
VQIVGVVIMIIRRVMTTTTAGPVLAIQYCPVLHNRNLLLNIIVLTPALVFPTAMHKERSCSLKTSCFIFLDGSGYSSRHRLFYAR